MIKITKANDKKKYTIRLDEDEFKQVEDKLGESGLSKQEYGRRCLLNKEIKVVNGVQELADQVRHIGININQVVHMANTNKYVTKGQIEEMIEGLGEIWQLLNNFL